MFGKLLKYDFSISLKAVSVSYIALATILLAELITLAFDSTWITVLLGVCSIIFAYVVIFMTFTTLAKLFHDTMYSAQGYLSFTLPVNTSTLFLSKVVVSTIWTIVSSLLLVGTFLINLSFLKDGAMDMSDGSFFDMIKETGILDMFPSTSVMIQFAIATAFLIICSISSFWSYVFFAITVANTQKLQSHPKIYGFGVFFALAFVINSLSAKFTDAIPLGLELAQDKMSLVFYSMASDTSDALFTVGIAGTLFNVIVAVGLVVATMWIIENKVDIKG